MFKKWALIVVSLLLSACSGAGSTSTTGQSYASELRGAVFDPPRTLVDFTMASTLGEDFTLSEHRGEVMLLYFGYRSCPDFCPTTFLELSQVYNELNQPSDRLKIIFVTIDPERDTLENLELYMNAFHEDFFALWAEGETLQDLEQQFGVVAQRQQIGDSALSYMFDHTASIFLIGPTGQLEAQYLYGTDYRDIVHDLNLIFQTM